jgi:hypothetical protein
VHNYTTQIIVAALLFGAVLAAWFGSKLRNQRGFAAGLALAPIALGVSILVIFLASYTQQVCQTKLHFCLPTSDTNIWNFVVFPLFCSPAYWLVMLAFRIRSE